MTTAFLHFTICCVLLYTLSSLKNLLRNTKPPLTHSLLSASKSLIKGPTSIKKHAPSRSPHSRVSCPPQPTLPKSTPSPQDRQTSPRNRGSLRRSPSSLPPLLASGSTAKAPAPPQDPVFSLLIGSSLLTAKFLLVKQTPVTLSRPTEEPALQSLQLVNSEERFQNGSGHRIFFPITTN